MVITFSTCSKEDITNQLSGFCQLMDILPPTSPNELVGFLRKQYAVMKPEVLGRALNAWASGDSPITKPKRLNGYFIAQVMNQFLTSQRSVAHADIVPERPVEKRIYSEFERKQIFMDAYKIHKDDYRRRFVDGIGNVNIIWGAWPGCLEWVKEMGWLEDGTFSNEQCASRGKEIRSNHIGFENMFNIQMSAKRKSYRQEIVEHDWVKIGELALYFESSAK